MMRMVIKQQISFFLLACLSSLLSCQRIDFSQFNREGESLGGTVQVNFQIASIEQVPFENITSRSASVASLCSRFTVTVFRDSTKIKTVNQTAEEESFGTVSMALQPGTYQLVAIAHSGQGNCTVSTADKISFYNNKMTDTFYYYGSVTVSENNTVSIPLKRAVSMFRLINTDNMPEEVAQMKFYYTGGSSTFNAVTGFGCVNSRQTEIFEIPDTCYGKPSTFEVYTFPHALTDSLKMTVTALDASGNAITESTYTDVPIKQNVISQHTGTFFSTVTGTIPTVESFYLEGDGKWDTTIEH